jgi:hypothetical protein
MTSRSWTICDRREAVACRDVQGKSWLLPAALALSAILPLAMPSQAEAACAGTTRTWNGNGNQFWNNTANWSGANVPDTTAENAVIVAATRVPKANTSVSLSCFEIQSGSIQMSTNNVTFTIAGDYFRNTVAGSMAVSTTSFTVDMAGTAAQTFENRDPVANLIISNSTSVTFPYSFQVNGSLSITGSGTTVYVNSDLTLTDAATPLSIPVGTTVEVSNGALLKAPGGVTVAGTLRINPGSGLIVGAGKTVTVSGTGQLVVAGASGNIARIDGDGNSAYSISVAGSLNATYFRINHLTAAGITVTGSLQALNNGEFHYLASAGYAVTLSTSTSLPATMDNLGFFDDNGYGNVRNFNATGYAGSGSATLSSWAGRGGDANETGDTGGKITWGAQQSALLTLSDNTASGNPPSTVTVPGGPLGPYLFNTFAFALNQSATATDITALTITAYGTATAADVDYVQVYRDNGTTSCVYDASDSQIGGNLTLSGTPATATVTIPAGQVSTSGTTPTCIHVRALIKSSAAVAVP